MSDHKTIIEERVLPAIDKADELIAEGEDPSDYFLEAVRGMQEAARLKRQNLTAPNDLPKLDQLSEDLSTLEIILSIQKELQPGEYLGEPFFGNFVQVLQRWDTTFDLPPLPDSEGEGAATL